MFLNLETEFNPTKHRQQSFDQNYSSTRHLQRVHYTHPFPTYTGDIQDLGNKCANFFFSFWLLYLAHPTLLHPTLCDLMSGNTILI